MDTSLLEIFSARLRETRGNMMQATFAQKIGVSRASLSSYENGTRIPDIETLKRIHEETGVSLYYLLGLTNSRDDALATVQRDTGLTEAALEHFSVHPMSAKVINYLVDCGALACIVDRAAILHDDVRWQKRNPPKEWSPVMQKMRDELLNRTEKEMTDALVVILQEGNQNDELFNIPSEDLPSFVVVNLLQMMRKIRDNAKLMAKHDPENGKIAEEYTQLIKKLLGQKEAPNAQETPE